VNEPDHVHAPTVLRAKTRLRYDDDAMLTWLL
jgi:hypothetical protein